MNILGITGQTRSGKDTVADHLVEKHGYVKISLADPIKRFGREVFGFTDTQLWGPSENRNAVDTRYDYFCDVRPGGSRFTPDTSLSAVAAYCDRGWYGAAKALQACAAEWLEDVLPGADVQSLYDWFSAIGNNHVRLSPRVMLQHLGTEWGRDAAGADIWVNYMIRVAQEILKGQSYDRRVGLLADTPGCSRCIPAGVVVSDVRFHNELQAIRAAGGRLVRVSRPETDQQSSTTGIANHASELEQREFNDADFNVILHNTGTVEQLLLAVDTALGR